MKKLTALSRNEMRLIKGSGGMVTQTVPSCTASCQAPLRDVTCYGSECIATDEDGCTANGANGVDSKKCNPPV